MDISKLKEEYDAGGDFANYVDKYKKKHMMPDTITALKSYLVQNYWLYLHGLLNSDDAQLEHTSL